ncbi:hypothetical protein DDB_G0284547 [Dictyostelium discoideum AX4]|uniref:Uncharacterized protein n=1 Tax=Dictyostelium discoideum TaxID=44689 RepID=Q54PL9_DICDI|nr:hypothetical protein DDB_G0284547 [Dictyostelium discoideum AX4]EAL65200.1 hypothetical protein DDB_G0284547 [Dictyostelium discoideum AX4]|eukprot:XP_638513.1 hypothetical protein DDB_G0284547 [Dictyostelium discoideum AX4]
MLIAYAESLHTGVQPDITYLTLLKGFGFDSNCKWTLLDNSKNDVNLNSKISPGEYKFGSCGDIGLIMLNIKK